MPKPTITILFMDTCIFCKIINKELPSHLIWENERFMCFLNINPFAPGHALVIPKKHIDYLFDLPEDLYRELFDIAKKLAPAFQKAMRVEKVGLQVMGFGVRHAHLHIIPLSQEADMNPERAKPASKKELEAISSKIKTAFRQ